MYYYPLSTHDEAKVKLLIFTLGKECMKYSLLIGIADHKSLVANLSNSFICLTGTVT